MHFQWERRRLSLREGWPRYRFASKSQICLDEISDGPIITVVQCIFHCTDSHIHQGKGQRAKRASEFSVISEAKSTKTKNRICSNSEEEDARAPAYPHGQRMPCGSLTLSQISKEEYWLLLLLLEAAPPPASAADSARPAGRWINGDLRATDTETDRLRVGLGGGQLAFASRRTARLLPGEVRRAHVRGGPNNDAALA